MGVIRQQRADVPQEKPFVIRLVVPRQYALGESGESGVVKEVAERRINSQVSYLHPGQLLCHAIWLPTGDCDDGGYCGESLFHQAVSSSASK